MGYPRDFGCLAENLVHLKLRGEDGEVYYWKDKRGKEIDFVVKKGIPPRDFSACLRDAIF